MNLIALQQVEASRWGKAKILSHWQPLFDHTAPEILKGKGSYQTVSASTGVPWWILGVIHEREASLSWTGGLAQGDPWNRVSIHVPRGIGPFTSWVAAAEYALRNCAPRAALWKDWSLGGSLLLLEEYNGLGYARNGHVSPYLWSGTDQYTQGKYTSDGHYDPVAKDQQLGCVGLLMTMQKLDSSITLR